MEAPLTIIMKFTIIEKQLVMQIQITGFIIKRLSRGYRQHIHKYAVIVYIYV